MALEILTFIKEMAGGLVSPIAHQLDYLFHYKRNIDTVKKEGETLEAIRKDVQICVDDAKMKGEEVKNEVQAWLNRVDSITRKTQTLDDEGRMNKRCFNGWCPNCYWRYRVGKQAVKEAVTARDIQEKRNFGDNVSHPRPPPELMPTADFHPFESAKEAMMEVMEALKEDKIIIVGVYGMGGVGKTTMVNQVGTQVKNMGLFNYVVKAVVSQTQNLRKIQGQIADLLGLKLEEESDEGRASRLKETIMRRKRILIILDDVWSEIDLSQVGIPSGSDLTHCESKIILTTRQEHVCHVMGAQARIHHKLLSEEDSWILFRRKAGEVVDSLDIDLVARNVARECGGLPIALVTVGTALVGQDVEEWKKAARRLEKSETANPNDEGNVFKCIKLSYDYLRGRDTKACFLICSLFPEDYDINVEDLVRYGTGLGLFQDAGSMEEARGDAQTVVKHLQASCLLLDTGRKGYVKMHDVIRDIAIRIASSGDEHVFMVQAGLQLKRWPQKDSLENYTGISLMSNEISNLPDELECPKLQALLLQDNTDLQEIPRELFRKMITLKILDLSSIQISSLPTSIGLLTNLQTLCLDGCRSTDISALGNLKKLKILSLKESFIEALPEQMGQLSNLRILDLTMSSNVQMIPPNVISGLSCLEELYMQGSFAEWRHGVKGEEEEEATTASFDEIIDLPCLTILKVDISDYKCMPRDIRDFPKWIKYDICISGDRLTRLMNVHVSRKIATTYSKGLVLDTETRNLPFWFNGAVSKGVENLMYSECGLRNILVEYDEGELTALRSLFVQQCLNIFSLMNAVDWIPNKPVFENLEDLRVHYMNNMKELCIGELPQGSFRNLKYLDVQQCEELGNALLQSNLLQKLQILERINVSGNSSLREMFRLEGHEEGQFYLRRLREMKVENLPELIKIWNGPTQPTMFHNLNVVIVVKCKQLRNLFTLTITAGLLQLEALWIEDCHALEFIVGKEEGEESGDKLKFPQLKSLSLLHLPNLSSFYAGSTRIECPSLEQLYVQGCPNVETRTSNFHSTKQVEVNNDQHLNLLRNRLRELR